MSTANYCPVCGGPLTYSVDIENTGTSTASSPTQILRCVRCQRRYTYIDYQLK